MALNALNAAMEAALRQYFAANPSAVSNPDDEFVAQLARDEAAAAAQMAADEAAFKAQQDELDRLFKIQEDLRIKTDADAFAKAQSEIATQLAAEQQRISDAKSAYEQQQAAAQAASAQAAREAQIAQAEIAKQMAETKRLSEISAAKNKADVEAAQRTSAAKIAGSKSAGKSAANRSLLAGFATEASGPPTLGTAGGLGRSGGGLAVSQTLGVG